MGVITFEEVPKQIVEVTKTVLPTWAIVVIGVLVIGVGVAIYHAIANHNKKAEVSKIAEELTKQSDTLKSENDKLATELSRFSGGKR